MANFWNWNWWKPFQYIRNLRQPASDIIQPTATGLRGGISGTWYNTTLRPDVTFIAATTSLITQTVTMTPPAVAITVETIINAAAFGDVSLYYLAKAFFERLLLAPFVPLYKQLSEQAHMLVNDYRTMLTRPPEYWDDTIALCMLVVIIHLSTVVFLVWLFGPWSWCFKKPRALFREEHGKIPFPLLLLRWVCINIVWPAASAAALGSIRGVFWLFDSDFEAFVKPLLSVKARSSGTTSGKAYSEPAATKQQSAEHQITELRLPDGSINPAWSAWRTPARPNDQLSSTFIQHAIGEVQSSVDASVKKILTAMAEKTEHEQRNSVQPILHKIDHTTETMNIISERLGNIETRLHKIDENPTVKEVGHVKTSLTQLNQTVTTLAEDYHNYMGRVDGFIGRSSRSEESKETERLINAVNALELRFRNGWLLIVKATTMTRMLLKRETLLQEDADAIDQEFKQLLRREGYPKLISKLDKPKVIMNAAQGRVEEVLDKAVAWSKHDREESSDKSSEEEIRIHYAVPTRRKRRPAPRPRPRDRNYYNATFGGVKDVEVEEHVSSTTSAEEPEQPQREKLGEHVDSTEKTTSPATAEAEIEAPLATDAAEASELAKAGRDLENSPTSAEPQVVIEISSDEEVDSTAKTASPEAAKAEIKASLATDAAKASELAKAGTDLQESPTLAEPQMVLEVSSDEDEDSFPQEELLHFVYDNHGIASLRSQTEENLNSCGPLSQEMLLELVYSAFLSHNRIWKMVYNNMNQSLPDCHDPKHFPRLQLIRNAYADMEQSCNTLPKVEMPPKMSLDDWMASVQPAKTVQELENWRSPSVDWEEKSKDLLAILWHLRLRMAAWLVLQSEGDEEWPQPAYQHRPECPAMSYGKTLPDPEAIDLNAYLTPDEETERRYPTYIDKDLEIRLMEEKTRADACKRQTTEDQDVPGIMDLYHNTTKKLNELNVEVSMLETCSGPSHRKRLEVLREELSAMNEQFAELMQMPWPVLSPIASDQEQACANALAAEMLLNIGTNVETVNSLLRDTGEELQLLEALAVEARAHDAECSNTKNHKDTTRGKPRRLGASKDEIPTKTMSEGDAHIAAARNAKARVEAEEQSRQHVEEELEAQAKRQAEGHRQEDEDRARVEAQGRAKREAEEKARLDTAEAARRAQIEHERQEVAARFAAEVEEEKRRKRSEAEDNLTRLGQHMARLVEHAEDLTGQVPEPCPLEVPDHENTLRTLKAQISSWREGLSSWPASLAGLEDVQLEHWTSEIQGAVSGLHECIHGQLPQARITCSQCQMTLDADRARVQEQEQHEREAAEAEHQRRIQQDAAEAEHHRRMQQEAEEAARRQQAEAVAARKEAEDTERARQLADEIRAAATNAAHLMQSDQMDAQPTQTIQLAQTLATQTQDPMQTEPTPEIPAELAGWLQNNTQQLPSQQSVVQTITASAPNPSDDAHIDSLFGFDEDVEFDIPQDALAQPTMPSPPSAYPSPPLQPQHFVDAALQPQPTESTSQTLPASAAHFAIMSNKYRARPHEYFSLIQGDDLWDADLELATERMDGGVPPGLATWSWHLEQARNEALLNAARAQVESHGEIVYDELPGGHWTEKEPPIRRMLHELELEGQMLENLDYGRDIRHDLRVADPAVTTVYQRIRDQISHLKDQIREQKAKKIKMVNMLFDPDCARDDARLKVAYTEIFDEDERDKPERLQRIRQQIITNRENLMDDRFSLEREHEAEMSFVLSDLKAEAKEERIKELIKRMRQNAADGLKETLGLTDPAQHDQEEVAKALKVVRANQAELAQEMLFADVVQRIRDNRANGRDDADGIGTADAEEGLQDVTPGSFQDAVEELDEEEAEERERLRRLQNRKKVTPRPRRRGDGPPGPKPGPGPGPAPGAGGVASSGTGTTASKGIFGAVSFL